MTTTQQNKAQTFLSPYQGPMNVLMAPETVPLTELAGIGYQSSQLRPLSLHGVPREAVPFARRLCSVPNRGML